MNKYLSSSLTNVVSLDLETSWAARSLQEALKLRQLDARFQQKQMQEKEEKLLRLYENQQQRAFEKVGRGSAGSNTSVGSNGGGKVRQMFDERRQKAGIDKSYPLEPLKQKNGTTRATSLDRKVNTTRIVAKSVTQKSVSHIKNGKPLVSKREVVQRIYNNNNGDERFEEHRYENDDIITRNDSHRHLVDMMNSHNLGDDLDNEEMPQIGFDEPDELLNKGKLVNLGGKLPSENGSTKNAVEKRNVVIRPSGGALGGARKELTSVAKKPLRASPPTKTTSTPTASSPVSRNTTPTSPSKSMANKTPSVPTGGTNARAPTNTRPSAKQGPKSGVVRDDLAECKYCGRSFATDRLDKHQEICAKSGKKKRKVYDSTKHRVVGTEMEGYVTKKVKSNMSSRPSRTASKKDWRRTHEEFIATIRAAKQAQAYVAKGGKLADLPPPPPSSNPDYVQCPHCGRRFNEAAAARHIPKCANYEFNKPKGGQPPQKGRPGK